MPMTNEILSMFEFNLNPKIALSVNNHFDECPPSKQRSVPTVQWPYIIPFDCLIDRSLTKS